MNAITIRNLPPDLARAIREKAKADGTSLNRTVINLLRDRPAAAKSGRQRARYRDLDALAGSWTKAQAAEFEKELAAQRKIDPELWK
jgi:plasmid stability protein